MYHSGGQSIAEYVLLLAVISAALIAMHAYMRRGIQVAIKASADQLGTQNVISNRTQGTATTTSPTRVLTSVTRRIQNFLGGSQQKLIDTNRVIYSSTDAVSIQR